MKLTFLGTSHGYAELNRYTSCTLIEIGEKLYIVDAGGPVEYLLVNGGKNYADIRGVFITHMHSDHVGSLDALAEPFLRYRYNDKAVIYMPEKQGVDTFIDWLTAMHASRAQIDATLHFKVTEPGVIFDADGLTVEAIPTDHLGHGAYPAYAYHFTCSGRDVLFTGDMDIGFPDFERIVGDRHYNLVVCEMAHADLCNVIPKLQKLSTDRLVFNHAHIPRMEGYETLLRQLPFDAQWVCDGQSLIV